MADSSTCVFDRRKRNRTGRCISDDHGKLSWLYTCALRPGGSEFSGEDELISRGQTLALSEWDALENDWWRTGHQAVFTCLNCPEMDSHRDL